jgi:hypothetical protein
MWPWKTLVWTAQQSLQSFLTFVSTWAEFAVRIDELPNTLGRGVGCTSTLVDL